MSTRQVTLTDRFLIDGVRITNDGYMTASPRVARTGVQLYRGSEVGMKDKAVVRVYRPEDEVFSQDALASLTHKPLTNDHPSEPVTADNWKKYAVGQVGDEAVRDGEAVRVPMVLMDKAMIQQVQDGKRQLSVGYTCDIIDEAGTAPDGSAYDAVQRNIRGNHIAIVQDARGGPRLAIGDAGVKQFIADAESDKDGDDDDKKLAKEKEAKGEEFTKDSHNKERFPMAKTMTIDGVSVTFDSEQSAQIAERAIQSRDAKITDMEAKHASDTKALRDQATANAETIATLTKDKDALTGENAALKKQVEDSKVTPAKLDEMVRDRDALLVKAKAVMGDKLVIDGKTDAEIRKQVVDAKLGTAAAGFNDDQISAAFTAFTADVKVAAPAISDGRAQFAAPAQNVTDMNAFYDKRDAALQNRWNKQAAS